MGEVCDAAYLCQWQEMEREALLQLGFAPHVGKDVHLPTPAEVKAEFDAWLVDEPQRTVVSAQDLEQLELFELLGVAGKRKG